MEEETTVATSLHEEERAPIPPSSLLSHPPLASLANDLLEALNQLRYFAVEALKKEFTLRYLVKLIH